jgi:hypothetical protein
MSTLISRPVPFVAQRGGHVGIRHPVGRAKFEDALWACIAYVVVDDPTLVSTHVWGAVDFCTHFFEC